MPWSGTARNMLQLSLHADFTTHTLLAKKQRAMAAILKFLPNLCTLLHFSPGLCVRICGVA